MTVRCIILCLLNNEITVMTNAFVNLFALVSGLYFALVLYGNLCRRYCFHFASFAYAIV